MLEGNHLIGAIDIGGTKIAVGVVDDAGRIVDRMECPTAAERGFLDGLGRIVAMLRETAARAGAKLHGIGVGCTGPVDPFTGVLGTVDLLPGWQGGAIVAGLSVCGGAPSSAGSGRGSRQRFYRAAGAANHGRRWWWSLSGAHPNPLQPLCWWLVIVRFERPPQTRRTSGPDCPDTPAHCSGAPVADGTTQGVPQRLSTRTAARL